MEMLVGPRWEGLHKANVTLRARARTYRAGVDAGPFSVKGVLGGEVIWCGIAGAPADLNPDLD